MCQCASSYIAPTVGAVKPTFSNFDTGESDAECVEALGKRSDDELNSWNDARPTQGADGAEKVPGVLRVGEQLSQEHLNGCVCPYMDIPHHLDMQDMCGSRSIRRGI